jgi:hypothetical protein
MTTAQHTPGPWEIVPTVQSDRKNIFSTRKGNEYHIGTLISGSRSSLRVFRANTRLIAAAPDLLEAAELVIARWSEGDLAEAVRMLDAAVSSAKGGSI